LEKNTPPRDGRIDPAEASAEQAAGKNVKLVLHGVILAIDTLNIRSEIKWFF
jgi:hypothetical protein